MFENYDVRYLYMPASLNRDFSVRIFDTLVATLNSYNKLPRAIIVLIESDFKNMGETTESFDISISWLLANFYRAIALKKVKLKSKCFCTCEPKFLFLTPFPTASSYDINGKDSQLRCWFNRCKRFTYE